MAALFVADHDVELNEIHSAAEDRRLLCAERHNSHGDRHAGRDQREAGRQSGFDMRVAGRT